MGASPEAALRRSEKMLGLLATRAEEAGRFADKQAERLEVAKGQNAKTTMLVRRAASANTCAEDGPSTTAPPSGASTHRSSVGDDEEVALLLHAREGLVASKKRPAEAVEKADAKLRRVNSLDELTAELVERASQRVVDAAKQSQARAKQLEAASGRTREAGRHARDQAAWKHQEVQQVAATAPMAGRAAGGLVGGGLLGAMAGVLQDLAAGLMASKEAAPVAALCDRDGGGTMSKVEVKCATGVAVKEVLAIRTNKVFGELRGRDLEGETGHSIGESIEAAVDAVLVVTDVGQRGSARCRLLAVSEQEGLDPISEIVASLYQARRQPSTSRGEGHDEVVDFEFVFDLELAKAKLVQVLADERVQATAASAVGGAVLGGTGGGVAGLVTGSTLGAALALIPAVFTLGLSIPFGAVIGAGCGMAAGTAVGSATGAALGGAGMYLAFAEQRDAAGGGQ